MLRTIETVVVVLYSLLIFNDYFSETFLASKILEGSVVPLSIVLLVILNIYIYENKEKEERNKWHIFNGVYILLLLSVMTVMGGESKLGIELSNPLVWLFIIYMLKEEIYKWLKKIKEKK